MCVIVLLTFQHQCKCYWTVHGQPGINFENINLANWIVWELYLLVIYHYISYYSSCFPYIMNGNINQYSLHVMNMLIKLWSKTFKLVLTGGNSVCELVLEYKHSTFVALFCLLQGHLMRTYKHKLWYRGLKRWWQLRCRAFVLCTITDDRLIMLLLP